MTQIDSYEKFVALRARFDPTFSHAEKIEPVPRAVDVHDPVGIPATRERDLPVVNCEKPLRLPRNGVIYTQRAIGSAPGRRPVFWTCDQFPGRTFSTFEAAELAQVALSTIHTAVERGGTCGKLRFKFRKAEIARY